MKLTFSLIPRPLFSFMFGDGKKGSGGLDVLFYRLPDFGSELNGF